MSIDYDAVEAELHGEATEDQLQGLNANIDAWKVAIVNLNRDIDQQLTERKAKSIAAGSWEVRQEYETWKGKAMGKKRILMAKIAELKLIIKQRVIEDHNDKDSIQEEILEELISIRELLEAKLK